MDPATCREILMWLEHEGTNASSNDLASMSVAHRLIFLKLRAFISGERDLREMHGERYLPFTQRLRTGFGAKPAPTH